MSSPKKPVIGLEIHLKSGSSFEVDVTEWTYSKTFGGDKTLAWSTPDAYKGRRRLAHVDMDQVAAIVEVAR